MKAGDFLKRRIYTKEDLRKIARLEDPGSDLWTPVSEDKIVCNDYYEMDLDDLQNALTTIITNELSYSQVLLWIMDLERFFIDYIGPEEILTAEFEVDWLDYKYPDVDLKAFAVAWYLLNDFQLYLDDSGAPSGNGDRPSETDDPENESDDRVRKATESLFSAVLRAEQYIEYYHRNKGLPEQKRDYPDFMKSWFIQVFDDEGRLEKATDVEKKRFLAYVDELAAKDDINALRARCYGKYCGNAVYGQDFMSARDDAKKLFELTKDPFYANTLGYIYYYGRCNNGTPEYEKAFRYYTFGAANGVFESIYKLADMYRNGYGVPKSEETAFRLVAMYYEEIDSQFRNGSDDGPYADVALRMGSMYLHGQGVEQDPEAALVFLLQARYAIKRRMAFSNNYGDNVVAANIQKCIAEAKKQCPQKKNTGKIMTPDFWPVKSLMRDNYRISWKARQLKDRSWAVTFRRIPWPSEERPAKIFLTVPSACYCDLTDTVKGHVKPAEGRMPDEGRADFITTREVKGRTVTTFYYDGAIVLELEGSEFELHIPKAPKTSGKTVRLAGVTFTPGGRQYDYLCDDESVKAGDKVIVNGYDGPKEVEVQSITVVPVEDLALPIEKYKKIVGVSQIKNE